MTVIGRPREFDREAALRAAMLVFWRKGFAATSMADLCDAMGIRSPSLYAAFGNKESLYLEAVAHYAKVVGPQVWGRLGDGPTARAGVESLLLSTARLLPEREAELRGCMVTLGGVGEESPNAISKALKDARLDGLEQLRARFGAAVDAGELPPSTDVDGLSRFYLGVFQGVVVQAHDGATAAELTGMVMAAMAAWPGV